MCRGEAAWGEGGLRNVVADSPAIERADGWYRFMVQIRSATSNAISSAWRWISKARPAPKDMRVAIDIDALDVM